MDEGEEEEGADEGEIEDEVEEDNEGGGQREGGGGDGRRGGGQREGGGDGRRGWHVLNPLAHLEFRRIHLLEHTVQVVVGKFCSVSQSKRLELGMLEEEEEDEKGGVEEGP